MADDKKWYFCLDHKRVEQAGQGCQLDHAMGPYATEAEARNEAWDEEDRKWEGDD